MLGDWRDFRSLLERGNRVYRRVDNTIIRAVETHHNWEAWIISCINHGYIEYDRLYSENYKINDARLEA